MPRLRGKPHRTDWCWCALYESREVVKVASVQYAERTAYAGLRSTSARSDNKTVFTPLGVNRCNYLIINGGGVDAEKLKTAEVSARAEVFRGGK